MELYDFPHLSVGAEHSSAHLFQFPMDAPSLPGCISEGETEEEALTNIKEAIELYLEPIDDEKFKRELRCYSKADDKLRAIYEHGYQADFANNQDNWSGAMGREITIIVGMMEYIYPDIDVMLGGVWSSISRIFSIYNAGLTPVKNPEQFNVHEYLNYYIDLMEKYNKGDTDNHHDPTDLVLSVIGHAHSPRLVKKPKNERMYYLMDCGSWVNGGHEFGVISGREMAVCQWGDETKQTIKPKKSYKKAPTARIMKKK